MAAVARKYLAVPSRRRSTSRHLPHSCSPRLWRPVLIYSVHLPPRLASASSPRIKPFTFRFSSPHEPDAHYLEFRTRAIRFETFLRALFSTDYAFEHPFTSHIASSD